MRLRACLLPILAALLAATPVEARQDDPRLDELFRDLQDSATSDAEARIAETAIWRIWTDPGDPELGGLMARGILAMASDDTDTALAAFDAVVSRDAGFAEGLNKRATIEFLRGDYAASVADIERTLALEPRHFGALSGLGQIYLELGNKPAALKAFEAALKIDPHLKSVEEAVKSLKKDLGGSPT